jgi:hypothetical protein
MAIKDLFFDRPDDPKDFNHAQDHTEKRDGHETIKDEEPENHRKSLRLPLSVLRFDCRS